MAKGQEWIVGTPEKPYDTSTQVSWVEVVVDVVWNEIYQNNPIEWQAKSKKIDLVIIGRLYCDSDEVSGITWHNEDPQELWNLYVSHGDDTNAAIKDLIKGECDIEVFGVIVKEV